MRISAVVGHDINEVRHPETEKLSSTPGTPGTPFRATIKPYHKQDAD